MKIITERDMQKLSDSRPADRLGFEWHHIKKMYDELPNAETTRLREQLAIAVGALKYYADGEHIRHLSNGDCVFEYGDQAQQALAQIREMGDV